MIKSLKKILSKKKSNLRHLLFNQENLSFNVLKKFFRQLASLKTMLQLILLLKP